MTHVKMWRNPKTTYSIQNITYIYAGIHTLICPLAAFDRCYLIHLYWNRLQIGVESPLLPRECQTPVTPLKYWNYWLMNPLRRKLNWSTPQLNTRTDSWEPSIPIQSIDQPPINRYLIRTKSKPTISICKAVLHEELIHHPLLPTRSKITAHLGFNPSMPGRNFK